MSMVKKHSEMTRVEQIRARRSGGTREKAPRPLSSDRPNSGPGDREERARKATAAVRHPYTPPPPPVITRGGYVGVPLSQKNRGKVRRQFYYSLGNTGAEVRLPSMPSISLGWRAVSGFISLLLLGAVFLLWNAPQFQIQEARVSGAQRIGADEILAALNVKGLPVVEANPAELTAALTTAFPDLAKVSVSVGLPARVVVSITERVPLLAWEQDGKIRWVDKDGYAFEPRGDAGVDLIYIQAQGDPDAPQAPAADPTADPTAEPTPESASGVLASLLTPKPATPLISTELIQAIEALKPQVPDGQSIAYSPSYGLGWTDPQGWTVYFGKNLSDMPVKLDQYKAIVADLTQKGIKPSLISVEYLHAPFYRSEQ